MKLPFFLFILFILFSFTVNVNADTAGSETSHSITLQAAYPAAAKIAYTFNCKVPFLQGGSPLTEGNNLSFFLQGELSPVSIDGLADIIWTPAAFLEFNAGVRAATGWNISLFGEDIYGIGFNRPDINGFAENDGSAFDGVIIKAKLGGAFQFDLAAIFPGEWNHVIFRTYHEIFYHAYSRAKSSESWYYENEGENSNGFHYFSSYIIGYQMPLVLNMVAFMAESQRNLYSISGESTWGGNLTRWTLSPVLNFKINQNIDIMLLAQFRTERNYIESGTENRYYRTLTVDKSNPQSFSFYRMAAVLTYRFN